MSAIDSTDDRHNASNKPKVQSESTDDADVKVEYLDENGCWQPLCPDFLSESPDCGSWDSGDSV